MPAQVSQSPFMIRPDADFLENHPALRHAGNALARAYAASDQLVTDEQLTQIGQHLWQALDAADEFQQMRTQALPQTLSIIVESTDPAVQMLPWETLNHPEFGFLGKENAFTLSRRFSGEQKTFADPEQGPLRVLLFTSLPDDLDAEKSRLDVEEEQAQVLEALTPLIADGLVKLEMPDDGRFSTFQELLQTFQPHLLFLSGHGKFINNHHEDEPPYGIFLFEDENGSGKPIHEETIAKAFVGVGVGCVVLSACESGMGSSEALTNGLTWRLSQQGIPHVIGMRESLLDRAGTLFAHHFCDAIARQERVDVALQMGRSAITTPLKGSARLSGSATGLDEQSLGQWCLPMLISHDAARPLIDWQFEAAEKEQVLANQTLSTVKLPPRFLGRRSELRVLKSRLKKGDLTQLLITGPGGQGKTALAGKLAQDLQRRGYQVFAYSARPENQWRHFFISLLRQLNKNNREDYNSMREFYETEFENAEHILSLLLAQFNQKLVLFFDNLESLQDVKTQTLTDARLAAWIGAAQRLQEQGLVLLLTSRWRLPDWPESDHWSLAHASYGDFLQMGLQLVKQGQFSADFLHNRERMRQVYQTLHGNGRGLTFFVAAIQGKTIEEEAQFLQELADAETKVQMDMALDQIVTHLSADARALLHRLPAYQTPVPLEGIVKLGQDLAQAPAALLERLLAVSLVEKTVAHQWDVVEYQLPPLVTDWLQDEQVPAPPLTLLKTAAAFQQYLYNNERRTLTQAIATHQAMRAAEEKDAADRFALDFIVGRLNRAGLYRTLLTEWLPDICESENLKIKAEALGQTGKQHHHLGNYSQALPLFEHSLKISQEIGDKYGEGTTLNNISQIYDARGDYDTALDLPQTIPGKFSQEIGDKYWRRHHPQ